MKRNQYGFGVVEAILILVLIALIAFVGYRLWQANQDDFLGTETTAPTQTAGIAPQINDASDLDKAQDVLNKTEVGGNSEQELNSELDF